MTAPAAAQEQLGARLPWETNPLIEEKTLKTEEYEDQKKLIEEVAAVETKVDDTLKEKEQDEKPDNVIKINIEKTPEPVQEKVEPSPEPPSQPVSDEVKVEINKPKIPETPPEKAEAVPEKDPEKEKLEKIYENIGGILMDGWREYIREYEKCKDTGNFHTLPEIVRRTILDIARISVSFNADRKKENKESVNVYSEVMDGLKEIDNQIIILRLTEGENPKNVESLKNVMKGQIGQLIKIGKENRPALEEYCTGAAEQLNYWNSTENVPAI